MPDPTDLIRRVMEATGPDRGLKHSYYYNHPKGFLVVNDGPLTMELIELSDLSVAIIDPKLPYASWAWSADCPVYFVIADEWIGLFHVQSGAGLVCRKKSAELIRWYLEEPEKLALCAAALKARMR